MDTLQNQGQPPLDKPHTPNAIATNHARWHMKRGVLSTSCPLCIYEVKKFLKELATQGVAKDNEPPPVGYLEMQ